MVHGDFRIRQRANHQVVLSTAVREKGPTEHCKFGAVDRKVVFLAMTTIHYLPAHELLVIANGHDAHNFLIVSCKLVRLLDMDISKVSRASEPSVGEVVYWI